MSSVSSSDRARRNDEVRNQREEYQNRESDQVKGHKKEMKRVSERHDQEVQELKEAYEKQIGQLRKRGTDNVSERDVANQAKIDKLRMMYQEQLKKKAEEFDRSTEVLTTTYKNQIEKERDIDAQQKDLLRQNFETSLQDKDRVFTDMNRRNRDEMKEAISSRTEKLHNKHEKEVKAIVEDRDTNLSQAALNAKEQRRAYENKIKNQERTSQYKLDKTNDAWKNNYRDQESTYSELLTGKTEQLQMARERIQDRYGKALEAKLGDLDSAHQSLKTQTQNRIDREVRSAENENRRLRSQGTIEKMSSKRVNDLEKEHIVTAYEDRMNKLENEKSEIFGVVNEKARSRVNNVVDKSDKLLSQTNRDFKTRQVMTNERHNEDKLRTKVEHERQVNHLTKRTGDRVDKLMKVTAEAQVEQQKKNDERVDGLRGTYSDRLAVQREAQMKQVTDNYMRMDQKLRNLQEKQAEKLETTVNNYETKISQLEESFKKEIKAKETELNQRIAARDKADRATAESKEMKFGSKLTQLQEEHNKEIDRLERRHQEQMSSLANRLEYYRKKA